MFDPRLLERATETHAVWKQGIGESETRYRDFEDALRALLAAGASSEAIVEVFPEIADWIRHLTPPAPELRATHEPLACSFCARTQDQAVKLIAGPGVYICDVCIERLGAEARLIASQLGDERCSFCGKPPAVVAAIVGGPTTRVCLECLDLCLDILREEAATSQP